MGVWWPIGWGLSKFSELTRRYSSIVMWAGGPTKNRPNDIEITMKFKSIFWTTKSRTRETPTLWTDADSKKDTIFEK